ncbi:MAG: HNH endonuclease, partial [Halobacteriaceae archaeon]
CVRCGTSDRIELHHIIPGESKPENLAVLCRDCHEVAHQGDFYTADLAYETRDEFWENWV